MTTDLLPSFGKYVEVHRLGEGGFGEVYRAVDTTLNRPVALKVPHRELLRDPGFVAQFRAEAQTAAQLDHPNIVRIYSVGEFEGTPFIEMELVEGQTLADLIKEKGRLTPEEALAIVEPVCAAVAEAHAKGIIHRDIKPGNILIRASDGRVLVTDFGLAKARESSFQASLSSSNVVVGTFRYMPPEQANRKLGDVGPASDIYSLGVVLYEMLTGRVPFDSKSVGQLIYEHTTEPPEPPSNINIGVSRSVESVVLKALQKKPEDRFGATRDMAQALRMAVVKGEVVPGVYPEKPTPGAPTPSVPTLSSPVASSSKRRSTAIIVFVVGLVAVIVTIVLLSRFLRGSSQMAGVARGPTNVPAAAQTSTRPASKGVEVRDTETPRTNALATIGGTATAEHTSTPTPTITSTSTGTSAPTGTSTATATKTAEPTATPTTTSTQTPTRTPTASPTQTPTQTPEAVAGGIAANPRSILSPRGGSEWVIGEPWEQEGVELTLTRLEVRAQSEGGDAALRAWFRFFNKSGQRLLVDIDWAKLHSEDSLGNRYGDWEGGGTTSVWVEPGASYNFDRSYTQRPREASRVPATATFVQIVVEQFSRINGARWQLDINPALTPLAASDPAAVKKITESWSQAGLELTLKNLELRAQNDSGDAAARAWFVLTNRSNERILVELDFGCIYLVDSFGQRFSDWEGGGLLAYWTDPGKSLEFDRYYALMAGGASRITRGATFVLTSVERLGPFEAIRWQYLITR